MTDRTIALSEIREQAVDPAIKAAYEAEVQRARFITGFDKVALLTAEEARIEARNEIYRLAEPLARKYLPPAAFTGGYNSWDVAILHGTKLRLRYCLADDRGPMTYPATVTVELNR